MTNAELAESAKGRENRRRGTLPAATAGVVGRGVHEAQR
jgi:hypothetical protein